MQRFFVALKKLYKKPLPLSICMNIAFLAICLAIGSGKFSSLDDYFMSSVLTGAYGGQYDVHMYFINVIYGYFLKPFYILFPKVSWYTVFQTFTVLASFTALCFVSIKRFGKKLGVMFAIMLLICVSPDFYLHVAFTQCAGIATAAGIFLLAIGNIERKCSYLVAACIFMLVGIVFRINMFQLGMPTLVTILFFSFIPKKHIWKGTLIALAMLTLVYVGANKFNDAHYKGEYEYYAAYQGPRAYFGDGAFYEGDNFEAELEERDLPRRDFRYLRSWYFYDNNVFSLDSMRALIKIAERSRYVPNYTKMPFAVMRALSNTLLKGSVWCWALLCIAIIFFSNRRNWWVPWVSIGLISIPYTYLLMVNRVVGHVEVGVWVFAVIFVLSFIQKEDILDKKQTNSFLQIIGLVCIASLIISGTYVAFDKVSKAPTVIGETTADWTAFCNYAKKHPDDVFLLPFGRYKDLATHINHAYAAVEPGSWDNIYSSGYWNIHLPAMERELNKRGVSNIIKDVWHDNVYVVADEDALSLAPFYSDHYHEQLTIDTLMHFGKIDLLKYRKGKKDEIAQP
ncbi:MAG: hypothetical protein IKB97_09700 [Bacteroidaceae bacterium]|nr:hypothetical protein [Bacteroidaceae bacterium]